MKRLAKKTASVRPIYGVSTRTKSPPKRGKNRGKKLSNPSFDVMSKKDRQVFEDAVSKFEAKERATQKRQRKHILKKMPALQRLQDKLSPEEHNQLVAAVQKALNLAFNDGYDQGRDSIPDDPSPRAGDTPYVPAGSFIVTPYSSANSDWGSR